MKKALFLLSLSMLLAGLPGCTAEPLSDTSPATTMETTPTVTQPLIETQQEDAVMETQPQLLIAPQDSDFVRVQDYIPDIVVELKYATSDNFTGAVIYPFQDAYLRYCTVKKLMAVQEELAPMGLGLKIWDGFRPISAQFRLWEIYPDDTYVANPNVGFSNHSRGNAVDVTLVDSGGSPLEMPTDFDDFSGRADRDYSEIPETPRANAQLLETVMEKHGFQGYSGEWWHFNDTFRYEPEQVFDPGVVSPWVTLEGCSLLDSPSPDGTAMASLGAGEQVTVMGYTGNYALVTYAGIRGYVLCAILFPC